MELHDLKASHAQVKERILDAVEKAMDDADFIGGKAIDELENRLADYVGVPYCAAVSSGTDGLVLALMALGVERGDYVVTTGFSFFATAEAIALVGAVPVFADVNPNTFNLDSLCLDYAIKRVIRKTNKKPKAVIAVDIFGLPCLYDELDKVCAAYGIALIEDMAQSFGASYRGKRTGSFGRFAVTSFFPAKPLGCYGDGGAVFCHSRDDMEMLRSLRSHGREDRKYEHLRIGLNARLDTLQAVILHCRLDIFEEEMAKRAAAAKSYQEHFQGKVRTQRIDPGCQSAYAQFAVLLPDARARIQVMELLKSQGIPSVIQYPVPLHKQKAFAHLERVYLANCENLTERILSLPMHPYLTGEEVKLIAQCFLKAGKKSREKVSV